MKYKKSIKLIKNENNLFADISRRSIKELLAAGSYHYVIPFRRNPQ